MSQAFTKASEEIIHERFGDETVVLNLRTGQYFALNDAAASYWELVVSGRDIAQPPTAITDRFADFVSALETHQLIAPTESTATDPTVWPESSENPTIEVFDDLADLMMADPIHDADQERGWPHLEQP